MKIHPLFRWFGSKYNSVKHYPAPEHSTIIEPYAGSASYSLHYADRKIVIWDRDPNLQGLWHWLILSATQSDIADIPVDVPVGTDIRSLGLNPGQELLMKHWQRTNNVGDCWTVSPWNGKPGLWSLRTRARVSEEVSAIKHWRIEHPSTYAAVPSTWFIDPPYQYNYRYRSDLPPFEFEALAATVHNAHPLSQVICCEAVCSKTGAVPSYLPFEPSHRAVTSRRKAEHSHHSNELIYVRPR